MKLFLSHLYKSHCQLSIRRCDAQSYQWEIKMTFIRFFFRFLLSALASLCLKFFFYGAFIKIDTCEQGYWSNRNWSHEELVLGFPLPMRRHYLTAKTLGAWYTPICISFEPDCRFSCVSWILQVWSTPLIYWSNIMMRCFCRNMSDWWQSPNFGKLKYCISWLLESFWVMYLDALAMWSQFTFRIFIQFIPNILFLVVTR